MCHTSDFDHVEPYKPTYELAEPTQNRRFCKTPSEAKFWREAQESPRDWLIGPARGGLVVSRLPTSVQS